MSYCRGALKHVLSYYMDPLIQVVSYCRGAVMQVVSNCKNASVWMVSYCGVALILLQLISFKLSTTKIAQRHLMSARVLFVFPGEVGRQGRLGEPQGCPTV